MVRIYFDNKLEADADVSFEQIYNCIEDLRKKSEDCTGTKYVRMKSGKLVEYSDTDHKGMEE